MKIISYISILLILLLALLVVGSWIVCVTMPELGLRSMLTESGVRWFIGRFTEIMMTTVLVFMVLASLAVGAARGSKIGSAIKSVVLHRQMEYRQRLGLQLSFFTLFIFLVIIGYLLFAPHALLLGSTGHFLPGPFAIGVVPTTCLIIVIVSIVYGSVARNYRDITHLFTSMCHGFSITAPLFLLYILTMQLFYSTLYVLN